MINGRRRDHGFERAFLEVIVSALAVVSRSFLSRGARLAPSGKLLLSMTGQGGLQI